MQTLSQDIDMVHFMKLSKTFDKKPLDSFKAA